MKNKKYKTLLTDYAYQIGDVPHSYYPRPQMKRDSFICLNGTWQFGSDRRLGMQIKVPFVPESVLSGIEWEPLSSTVLYYKRTFSLPENFNTGRVLLHFGAVDTIADVYLNGTHLGTHEGGYHPFSFDITDCLVNGENEIFVKVTDELCKLYPYGKQSKRRGGMWYTPHSGIWQSVWLESVPKIYIEKLTVKQTATSVTIRVKGGEKHKKITLKASGEVFEFSADEFTFTPSEIHLWTPDTPYLYYFTLESGCDKVESYFALREIGIKEVNGIKRLTLNGVPYLFSGLLDQGYYPDGIILPATENAYRDDILFAKSLGFNMLRKHIKIEPLIFYHLCDTLGMVVFQDFVNNSDYSFIRDTAMPTVGFKHLCDKKRHKNEKSRKIFKREAARTLDLLESAPSVLYYTVFNEGWGQFCADDVYKSVKTASPDRIIDATSGWFVQCKSDVDSRHIYFKSPTAKGYDGKRPLVISEFGGYSHRVAGHLFGSRNYGYKTFDTREDFERAVLDLYDGLKPLVRKGASAFVLTQLSDVEDETNGLITYDRRVVKIDAARLLEKMNELFDEI